MSPEAQRIAIAEACGIDIENLSACCAVSAELEEYGICPACRDHTVFEPDFAEVPDYLNDLNAMHAAEKSLAPDQLRRFEAKLNRIVFDATTDDDWNEVTGPTPATQVWHATAAQRAEAFLRTIGKWKEGE